MKVEIGEFKVDDFFFPRWQAAYVCIDEMMWCLQLIAIDMGVSIFLRSHYRYQFTQYYLGASGGIWAPPGMKRHEEVKWGGDFKGLKRFWVSGGPEGGQK